jgi:hypothetical protein
MRKVIEARGEIHGYLSPSEEARAAIAYWWRITPYDIRRYPKRIQREMGEFMVRTEQARADAIEAAKLGAPTPGRAPRGRPKPGDIDGQTGDLM